MTYAPDSTERTITKDTQAFERGECVHADRIAAETDKAIGLSRSDSDDLVWLPKSQIDAAEMVDESAIIFVRDWLAREKPLSKITPRQ